MRKHKKLNHSNSSYKILNRQRLSHRSKVVSRKRVSLLSHRTANAFLKSPSISLLNLKKERVSLASLKRRRIKLRSPRNLMTKNPSVST